MRFSGFLKETPVCKKKTHHKNIQKSRDKGQKLAQSLKGTPFILFFFVWFNHSSCKVFFIFLPPSPHFRLFLLFFSCAKTGGKSNGKRKKKIEIIITSTSRYSYFATTKKPPPIIYVQPVIFLTWVIFFFSPSPLPFWMRVATTCLRTASPRCVYQVKWLRLLVLNGGFTTFSQIFVLCLTYVGVKKL